MDAPARGVRGLPAGYCEWQPPAALRPVISCLWAQVTPGGAGRHGLVLPDACTDLVWEQGRGAFVAGPDTGPVPTRMTAGTIMVGVRFPRIPRARVTWRSSRPKRAMPTSRTSPGSAASWLA